MHSNEKDEHVKVELFFPGKDGKMIFIPGYVTRFVRDGRMRIEELGQMVEKNFCYKNLTQFRRL